MVAGPELVGRRGALLPLPGTASGTVSGRIGALDGLRALALLGVLAYHVAPSAVPGGFLGVESFFVLSGFLLASLLIGEQEREGRIDIPAYAGRRLRRITPALVTLLAALVVLGPVLAPDDAHRLVGDVVSSLAGVTNWHLIADASSYFDQAGRPPLVRHLWSVAVEVQFYALCPFLVTWSWRRRRDLALPCLAGGVIASASLMALLYRVGDPSRAYYGTDARVGALLAGVALALVLARRREDRPDGSTRAGGGGGADGAAGRTHPGLAVLAPVGVLALVGLYLLADDQARWAYPGAFLATQAATLALITAAVAAGPASRLLAHPALRWLGARSFGIYLWHWPAVALLRPGIDVELPAVVAAAIGLAAAVGLGALSYRVVERPLLRPRTGLAAPVRARRRAAGAAAVLVALAGLATLLVRVPTADPLADTLRQGQRLLASQTAPPPAPASTTAPTPAPPTVAPAATASSAPPTTPRPAPPTTPVSADPAPLPVAISPAPTPAPPPVPATVPPGVTVRAIGDSVMVSAAGALQERLGPSAYIDAALNRQFADGIAVARTLGEEGGADTVVVHLGNNGPVRAEDADALLGELAGVRAVLVVNIRVNRPWQGANNQALADAVARHPQTRLVDWYAASEGHPEWFQSDGTHFRATAGPGARAFADLIAGAVPPPATTTVPPAPTTTVTPPPTTAPAPPPPGLG